LPALHILSPPAPHYGVLRPGMPELISVSSWGCSRTAPLRALSLIGLLTAMSVLLKVRNKHCRTQNSGRANLTPMKSSRSGVSLAAFLTVPGGIGIRQPVSMSRRLALSIDR
jgi:hypothetical protein